ncbi:MAG: TonB-dependent receptor [Terracidiphilus sp.]
MKRLTCSLLCGFCISISLAKAQSTDATLSGGVTDPAGTFIVGAEIDIANDTTGVVYTTTTNSSGIYYLSILPPGNYHVQVSKIGFKTLIKPDVTLNVQSALSLNFSLPVGATSESVTVDAASSLINTTNASVSTVVDQTFVENMPLNGRSFQDLISMTPGVVTQSPQNTSQQIGDTGDFSVNGQRAESNYYTVDGVAANISGGNGGGVAEAATGGTVGASTSLGTTQSLISVDALQEFRVQSSTYSAEYGRSPGGQFSLATRSGSNAFHGTTFDYLRNDVFDANDWFNDHYGDPAPALRQNDFGGTFSGPVWFPRLYNGREHTFFFGSYEGLRLTLPAAATIQYVPDLFMRQQALPAMQPILNAFPLPNGIDYGTSASPSLAQFIAPYSVPSTIDSTSVRVDEALGPKLALFFRYGDTPSSTSTRQNFALQTISSNASTYTFGATSQFSSRMNSEFRLGYARSESSQIGTLDTFGGATPTDLNANLGAGSFAAVEPFILFLLPGVGGPSYLSPYYGKNDGRQWNIVDTVSLSKGHHNLKFGTDYRRITSPIVPPNLEVVAEFFSASSILNGVPLVTEPIAFKGATPIFNELALFAQDEWRVRPGLSLSLGLRWELDPPPTEKHADDAYTLLGSPTDPASLSVAPQGTPLWKTSWYNFAPRLGIAWTPNNQPGSETVVRAGGGVFFDSANEIAAVGYSYLGFSAYNVERGVTIPYSVNELTVPISVTPPYSTVVAFPSHLQLPYTFEWNASLQQALGRRQTVTISYVGSNGRRLLGEQQLSLSSLNPNFSSAIYFPGNLTSSYNSLQVQFQRSVTKGIQAIGSYTWSHALDFGSIATELPLERGNSDFDVRNNFQAGLTWSLASPIRTEVAALFLGGWGVDARFIARTGFPVTLGGNQLTDPVTGSVYDGGLNIVANQPIYLYGSQYPGGRVINPAAFSLPVSGAGNAPRNLVRGFGENQLNIAVRRQFQLHNAINLQFRAEAFNVLNHPNFGYIDPTYTDATFGQATEMLNSSLGTMASQYQQGGPRSMQFALKLHF